MDINPHNPQPTPGHHEESENTGNTDHSDRDPPFVLRPRTRPSAPSNFSLPSSIPLAAKTDLTSASPEGASCIITRRKCHLECSHILARSTKLSERNKLEFCWGCKPGALNLDVAANMVWLSPEIYRCFDSSHWALVPSLDLLKVIFDVTVNNLGRKRISHFTKRFPNENRNYTFVQFQAEDGPITRFDDTFPSGVTLHQPPFFTLPAIHTHVHPYFVICNVAKKDIKHRPEPEPEPEAQSSEAELEDVPLAGYATLVGRPDLLERVRMCRKIYQLWMVMPHAFDNPDSFSCASQNPQSNPSSQNRTKNDGPNKMGGGNEPRQQQKAQGPALTDSASTMNEPRSIDDESVAVEDQHGHADIPYWSKVGNWLRDMDDSIAVNDSSGLTSV